MNLKSFKPIAFVFSAFCLLGLLWVNIAALLGQSAPFDLHFGGIFLALFPLWAFTIYYLNQTTRLPDEATLAQMSIIQRIRYLLGDPPDWAMILLAGFYAYAMYSFFLYMNGGITNPELVNGQYQVRNHGQVTFYTEAEYQIQHRLHLRAITGFFMAFFSVSTAVLAPWRREDA